MSIIECDFSCLGLSIRYYRDVVALGNGQDKRFRISVNFSLGGGQREHPMEFKMYAGLE